MQQPWERTTAFLKLFEPILLTYRESLAARKRMINLAASHVAAGRFPKKVKYLIVGCADNRFIITCLFRFVRTRTGAGESQVSHR